MTLLEATNKAYDWFSKNDSLWLSTSYSEKKKDDFIKVMLVSVEEEKDRALLILALDELEKIELVKSTQFENKIYWFLRKPFDSYEQSVRISPYTALSISKIINSFCDAESKKADYCDPNKITSKDIENLTYLFTFFVGQKSNKTVE